MVEAAAADMVTAEVTVSRVTTAADITLAGIVDIAADLRVTR